MVVNVGLYFLFFNSYQPEIHGNPLGKLLQFGPGEQLLQLWLSEQDRAAPPPCTP
jgi:hypothetical protein